VQFSADLVAVPEAGRIIRTERSVRLGDVAPDRRMRIDAVLRVLQDVGDDDYRSTGLPNPDGWVARRIVVEVGRFPTFREQLDVVTFCSGTGGRWAERRTSIVGADGGRIEAAALWVQVDEAGRPARIDGGFLDVYGATAAGRTVGSRLVHDDVPADAAGTPFPLRHVDLDPLGHVNNAAQAAVVEQVVAPQGPTVPVRVEFEYRRPIPPDGDLVARSRVPAGGGPGDLDLWLCLGTDVATSVRLRTGRADGPVAQSSW
jgi:acyl-ACP thioesterase